MSTTSPSTKTSRKGGRSRKPDKNTNAYHWYTPRFWHGMLAGDWFSFVGRHRYAIAPRRWGLWFGATCFVLINSVLAAYHRWRHGDRIAATEIKQPPLFIIGHWRSGSTFLHDLMVIDPRHTYADTYECISPNHFLSSGGFVRACFKWVLPSKRPMDNVATGWDRPQEDEFALMNMGAPSPYLKMAFPNHPCEGDDYLDFRNVSQEETERWKQIMLQFLKTITARDDRQIVLKSPTHTGRIKVLLELFPEAKFIHIVRDPLELYSSTMKLWPTLWWYQSLHIAKLDDLEEYVFDCYDRMYGTFFEHESLIDPSRICEVRYERLASDTLNEVRRVYEQLDLGDFEVVRPQMEAYLKSLGQYQPNKHEYDPETVERVMSRWGGYAERYGYRRDSLGES